MMGSSSVFFPPSGWSRLAPEEACHAAGAGTFCSRVLGDAEAARNGGASIITRHRGHSPSQLL